MEFIETNKLSLHELTEAFPPMNPIDFFALVKDIEDKGIQDPVWVINGTEIIDGRHRYLAAKEIGLDKIPVRFYHGKIDAALEFVFSANLHRRQLTISQRCFAAAKLVNTSHGGYRRDYQDANLHLVNPLPNITIEQAAKMFHVSRRSVATAKKIIEKDNKEVNELLSTGQITITKALKLLGNPVNISEISSAPEKISQELKDSPVQEEVHKGNLYMEFGRLKGTEQEVKALVHHIGTASFSVKDVIELVTTAHDVMQKGKYASVKNITYLLKENF
jgi:ParB-like chromosome segregation protein Spo0J